MACRVAATIAMQPGTWFSIELQATSKVPEWGGQPVRVGQEEDVILDGAGVVRWGYQRQTRFHLVRADGVRPRAAGAGRL